MSASHRGRQARLSRQASVMQEMQKTQDKDSLDGRYARLMSELSALCANRENVLTADSLAFFATHGRAEPVKLEREPDRGVLDSLPKGAGVELDKADELLSADAARRQRVEELTRFFMEAKSDIEFALGGSRDFRDLKDKEKDGDGQRDDDRGNETGDDDDEGKAETDARDPKIQIAKMHAKLLKEAIDNRVYNGMLSQIREQDPALYGAILCHPLITGMDPKKDKKKKKKRKDRERKDKTQAPAQASSSMLSPDFAAEPLSKEETALNVSRFVARSIAEGSVQGLLLATKVVLSFLTSERASTESVPPELPLASHLRVLRGESPPAHPRHPASTTKQPSTPTTGETIASDGQDRSSLNAAEAEAESDFRRVITAVEAAGEMDLDSDSGSLAKLRARLSRFGETGDGGEDDDEDDDDDDDGDDDQGHDHNSNGEEGVDEDALMARAIALSLSPEVTLKDAESTDACADTASNMDVIPPSAPEPKPRPPKFSIEELLGLRPFELPPADTTKGVDGVTAAMLLLTQMNKMCLEYLESCRRGILPNNSPVQPHPLTFMLLNSLLLDLHHAQDQLPGWARDFDTRAKWSLFRSTSLLAIFRVLEAHLFHVEVMGIAPASVGLGHIPKSQSTEGVEPSTGLNPLLGSLKSLISGYAETESATNDSSGSSSRDVVEIILREPSTFSGADVEGAAEYYFARVQEAATAAWVRGIAIFYTTQQERHKLLAGKLMECLKLLRSRESRSNWKFYQLDLLCARLALPDLSQCFVPNCVDVVEHDSADDGVASHKDSSDGGNGSGKTIDDSSVQNAALKTGKSKAKWSPTVIRASLEAGTLSTRCLFDYIAEHGPHGLLEATGLDSAGPSDDPRNTEILANAYDQMWDAGRKQQAEALECVKRLPGVIDLLHESVLSAEWPLFSFSKSYELVHAPLLLVLENRQSEDVTTPSNARVAFLRSLQDLMVQRLGGSRGDELPALEFDASRCAETMTLSDNNQTAKQHTAKQWGMVMATTGCPPNTGIHEWAVRLDRCEKGHIFLGVCTRDASVATYVGGDRQGWGLIGTRALWHNRSKVRGDYGDGFSTGSVVRVRLNTDSGALSFGVDDNDWGIAFDGLTQHGTLYPAIGLYQRDDQVTILPVQASSDPSAQPLTGDVASTKGMAVPAVLKPFLHHAGTLMEASCSFLLGSSFTDLVNASERQSPLDDEQKNEIIRKSEELIATHPILLSLVTPLISSLGLIRNYHGLASVLAMQFVPWCIKTMQSIEKIAQALRSLSLSRDNDDGVVSGELMLNVAGDWELKSMAAGNIPAQQYQLSITQEKHGMVQGRSSGSFTTVTLNGLVRGTKVCFLESWRQGGTCLVEGRLRADSVEFSGSYEDAKSHTSGHIIGHKIQSSAENAELARRQHISSNFVILEMAIANLLGYFGHALMHADQQDLLVGSVAAVSTTPSDSPMLPDGDSSSTFEEPKLSASETSANDYSEWVGSSLLSGGLPLPIVQAHLKTVIEQIADITGMNSSAVAAAMPCLNEATKAWMRTVEPKTVSAPSTAREASLTTSFRAPNAFLDDLINSRNVAGIIDRWVSKHVGESPFVRLGGEPMKIARRTICAAMIWHIGFETTIKKIADSPPLSADSEQRPNDNLMHVWRAAQRVIEWAIRAKNSMGSTYPVIAGLVIRKAQFLLGIEPSARPLAASAAVLALSSPEMGGSSGQAIASSKSAVFEYAERICSEVLLQVSRFIESPIRVSVLQAKMLEVSTRAFLRSIGLSSFRGFVGDAGGNYRSVLSADRHDTIQSTAVLTSTLQWLSQSLTGVNGRTHPAAFTDPNNFGSDSVTFASTSQASAAVETAHYLSGLGGCGKHLKNDLRESFENLYGYLCGALSRATWAKDSDLQLVILLAWGMIIQPDDHAFLSRVGIFRVLQTVLDEARGSNDGSGDGTGSPTRNAIDERSMLIESKKKIVQAALKVVHLLAAQVAQAGDTADDIPGISELQGNSALSLGSIPLLRKPSGPETLGKSVFHMLYTELKNALEEMRSSRAKLDESGFGELAVDPAQVIDPSTPASEDEFDAGLNDAQEYCYQICTLLYSVSGSPVCRSHLSSSAWLRLLLALVDVNSPEIQRRILKLLRRLLPGLDPSSIKVRYDEDDSFDMDSDEDIETDSNEGLDHASTLINFFFSIVALNNPPSVPESMMQRSTSAKPGEELILPRFGDNAGALSAEVILLLRSLYESDKWGEYLNRSVVAALGLIPQTCVTELGNQPDVADSDVEMEDLSKDIPSLDAWKAQMTGYFNALSALCILDGQIEDVRVGGTVKVMPRTGSTVQDIAFRGARGTVVAYEPGKSTAEVLLHGIQEEDTNSGQQQSLVSSTSVSTKPVRIAVDDLVAISEVDLAASNFSDPVLNALLVDKFPYFVDEVKKSLAYIDALENGENGDMDDGNGDDSDNDDDDMSNDGSSSPSALDSEMAAAGGGMGEESEADSDIASPRFRDSAHGVSPSGSGEPTSVAAEMEKESRLYRILLAYYGLRSSATLLKSEHCASTFVQGVGARGLMNLLTVAISETPTTAGIGDISSLEETWVALWARWYKIRSVNATPKPPAEPAAENSKSGDGLQADTEATGPMVQQMMEMGFPKEWCDVALARCAFNVEAAINFCFEHSSEMERLVTQHRTSSETARSTSGGGSKARKEEADAVSPLLEQLSEMGFPFNWCKKALAANRNNVDAALTWILSNGEALEAEDRRDEEAKLRAAGGEVSEGSITEGGPAEVEKMLVPNPLRVVSGQACIGEHDMMVEGLLGGGFASVGAPDCLVSSGRWYYEATLLTNGCIQIGWTDVAFSGAADRGDGVGDGAHSWAYDGWRQQKWHGQPSPWGSKWQQGDVVGCGIDVDAGTMIFSLNGKMRSANMGVAFRSIDFARGVYPCASFNRRERLQFNLGGAPFKFSPPPGFRPILQVLSDSGSLESLPKGFGVIGMRQDCLEENMGEENYSSDTRYFPRDAHPSMLRGSSSHGRSSAFAAAAGSKSDALAGIKAIPDDRIYVELMLVTRSLAILQARRALVTLLAKWPADVGPFNMKLLSATTKTPASAGSSAVSGHEEAARLVDFIKLTAGLSAQFAPGTEPTATATLSDSDILQLLDCGATGRYALGLVTDVTRSALFDALSATIRASASFGAINYDPLVSVMLSAISSEVKQASRRQYARIPWDAPDVAITANFLQITAEAGQAWSDREVLHHPNLFLAEWMTSLMVSAIDRYADEIPEHVHDRIRQEMLEAWISALKSPSLCVKERGAMILAGIYQDLLPKHCPTAIRKGLVPLDERVQQRLKAALDVLPLQRLVDLAQERILREAPNMPVCSRYLQSITELVAAAALAMNAMGKADEALFAQDTAHRLEACRRIESDLYPIDQAEYEEMVAAKIQEQKEREAAEAAKLEALAAEREAKEAADAAAAAVAAAATAAAATTATAATTAGAAAAGAASGTAAGDSTGAADTDADAGASTAVARSSVDSGNKTAESEATNMEVDNSDAEEQQAGVSLSVIAKMASEDNVDGSVASVGSPEQQQHADLPPVDAPIEKEMEFAFQFPDPEPVFDTSMLNESEKSVLEAASRGITGEEDLAEWAYGHEAGILADMSTQLWSGTIAQLRLKEENEDEELPQLTVGCKVIRGPNWKWRDQDGGEGKVGTVEGISPWSGVDGEGMSVRWPNDSLYTYRWGADGNFDLIHVDVDEEGNVTHQYPTPKAKNDDEGTFGSEVHLGVLLHLFHSEEKIVAVGGGSEAIKVSGIMEFPDYSATVSVVGLRYADGSLCVQELQMTRGNPDMGWTLRFGTEKWQPGTKYILRPPPASPPSDSSGSPLQTVDSLRGEYSHHAFKNGAIVQVRGEIAVSTRYLFTMDPFNHFPTLGISEEGMTVTCLSGESRNLALGTVGFATGIHYWEVRVDQAEFGSVFIGVCEKAGPPGSQAALSNRLNRWHGWGFVNFRATYHNSTERIYGDHFNAGDTIGVRLDMEQGKLSFFVDGIKFGEHIVSDLGVAFDNVKGERHSRTLYPCIGMRKGGDRISLNGKWVSMPGIPPRQILSDVIDVSKSLHAWYLSIQSGSQGASAGVPMSPMTGVTTSSGTSAPRTTPDETRAIQLPDSLLRESWLEWKRWRENRYQRCPARPRGVVVDFDTSLETCVAVSKAAGLSAPFLAGDRVRMISKCGQELNQPEEAVIVGVYRGSLWYRVETQGNEGADEGRAWAWYWSASELVELILVRRNSKDMTLLENDATDLAEYQLNPENMAFAPRSELEQRAHTDFDAFVELATRGHSAASDMQLVERLNSHCATVGVEVVNLKIMEVVTPEEVSAMDVPPATGAAPSTGGRSRSLILEGYFSTPALKSISGPAMRARCAVLRVLNGKLSRVLPMICMEPSDSSASAIEVARSRLPSGAASSRSRSELLSTSLKLRSLRRLVFTSTKLAFWDDVLRATTTSTPLPSDEYEDPREIRVIRINRIQAQPSKLSLLAQPGARLRRSVFGQLFREMRSWNDSFFRRAYVGKGHGGQKRAFKVKFLGEGVNDYGGPYRAVFEQVVDELQMDNVELSKGELGLLPLLIPCPNRRSGTGINQDKFLLNPSCGTSLVSNGPMALDLHRFLGKIIGTGVRHGLQMGLDLPSLVWRPLAGLDVSRQHLESVDVVAANNLSRVEELNPGDDGAEELLELLTMSAPLSDGTEVPLLPNSEKTPVTMATREAYVRLVETLRLTESSQQLAALKDGLASVLPMELAPLFTARELEVLICGRREVDVDLLKQCTEYSDGADESMPHVQAFWEVLREMTSEDRTSFLRFVWARSRMPNSAKDFPMNFKLQTAHDAGSQGNPDAYLPHAQTCFFALRLPAYTSKEVLRAKLLYAIQNSPNMDADVRLHNAEGWADA